MKVTIKDDVMRNKIKDTLTRIELLKSLQQENQQLKEVIEEVREVAQELKLHYQQHPTMIPDVKLNKLLQILDKGVKND